MGAVHPLADESVSTEFPERSFLLVWPEGSRNARGRGASREEVLCHRKPVSLLFSTRSVRMRHGGDALCRYSKTQSKPSTAGSIWRGGTVEWTSFRIYAETNDTKLAPTTAADTTAKLGCGTMPHVSCDPPGRGSRGMRFLRCRGHALTMTRRIGKLPNSLDGFQRRTVLSGSPWSNFFYDRQVPFHRHSCRPVTGSRLGVDYIKRHGSDLPQWVSVNFSCLCSSLDIPFSLCRFKHRLLLLQDHSKWGTDAVRPSFPNSCPGRWLLKGRPTGHRRTNLTACAMRVFPRSQVKYLSPRFQRSAHKESITGFIYHNILNMSR